MGRISREVEGGGREGGEEKSFRKGRKLRVVVLKVKEVGYSERGIRPESHKTHELKG